MSHSSSHGAAEAAAATATAATAAARAAATDDAADPVVAVHPLILCNDDAMRLRWHVRLRGDTAKLCVSAAV